MERRPIHYVFIEVAAVLVAWTCFAILFWRSTQATASSWLSVVLAILSGWILSDFVSGLVHWGMDTWGSVATPIIGKMMIHPFREHHDDPTEMTRHNYFEVNGHNALVLLFVMIPALFIPPSSMSWYAALLSFAFGIIMTNQIHKWSHLAERPALVTFLQKTRLILPAGYHHVHHTAPHMKAYSITNGWTSPLLDRLGFYRGVERLITAVTGERPRA